MSRRGNEDDELRPRVTEARRTRWSPQTPHIWMNAEDRNSAVTVNELAPVTTTTVRQRPHLSAQRSEPSNNVETYVTMPSPDMNIHQLPPNSEVFLSNESNYNNINNVNLEDLFRSYPELIGEISIIAFNYIPFLFIFLSKAVFDHIIDILLLLALFFQFYYFNFMVMHEVALQSQRRISVMLFGICLIFLTIYFDYCTYTYFNLYFGLIFMPPYSQSINVKSMLWSIMVSDYILKFITIVIKMIVIMMPTRFFPILSRGKIYLFIEITSQMFRCCVPTQPWLYYMFESYQGPKKVFGVFLFAFYMILKSIDLMFCIKRLCITSYKLLQNVILGTAPSKEQISEAGNSCPICFEKYSKPVLLQCQHIFCEVCITIWLNREQTCPLCRAKIANNRAWRDGSTAFLIQIF